MPVIETTAAALDRRAPAAAPRRVLVIDDDAAHASALAEGLEVEGYVVQLANSGGDGLERMSEASYDAVLCDLVMHDVSGLEVLRRAQSLQPQAALLLITGHGSIETAVEAMRNGATDYLTKPVRLPELRTRLARLIDAQLLAREHAELRAQLDKRYGFEGIIGESPLMQRVFDVLRQVSPTNATVLILGESGTGKELVARAVHENSPRKHEHFVAVNCAALSEGLIESELFGHVKGAFTGAVAAKEGRIVYADRGTLFLDEVGDMPLETQAKLLRVLEMREVVAVGGNASRKVDVRLVAATNRDLRAMVKEGRFREDLLFRLQVVTITLPPLRERPLDIPLLIDHFLREFARSHGRSVRGITPEARTLLVRASWPGNVRELRNAVESMVLLARSDVLDVKDVPETVLDRNGGQRAGTSALPSEQGGGYDLRGKSAADVERELIRANLVLVGGNRQKAAKILQIGERTLYRKIKEYGLE
ncbi:MAG: sigma-54-dependent Fis family transcriptional regulator [Planctomycetes bacterium]|nr:sigma-54-dependent Fis family transcriptional regulator [Planctomycetota bacterium]